MFVGAATAGLAAFLTNVGNIQGSLEGLWKQPPVLIAELSLRDVEVGRLANSPNQVVAMGVVENKNGGAAEGCVAELEIKHLTTNSEEYYELSGAKQNSISGTYNDSFVIPNGSRSLKFSSAFTYDLKTVSTKKYTGKIRISCNKTITNYVPVDLFFLLQEEEEFIHG
ncbi:hypothetical protein ACCT09_17585 [Rhizobium ruizarguesonis]